MKGWMYILECANGSYYTGSTNNLPLRIEQHQNGEGANYTKKHLPVKLLYFEEFQRIDQAFYREKQVQGWSRKKKNALINGKVESLHIFASCLNESHSVNKISTYSFDSLPFDSAQGPEPQSSDTDGKNL